MNVYRFLSRLFFLIAVVCFIAAGWLWWDARAAEPLVLGAAEIDVGVVTQKEPRIVEIAVTNRGPAPLRLAGLDNELCWAPLRCSRAEQDNWPIHVPAHGTATVRLELVAYEPGPFTVEQAFWSAETELRRVPFTIRGSAE